MLRARSPGAAHVWQPIPEVLWRSDPQVEAARQHNGWPQFHRAAGQIGLYFDHVERDGRRGQYLATAFTLVDRVSVKLADGRGATPITAVAEAYRLSGRGSPDADQWLAVLQGVETDFADLLGGGSVVTDDPFGDLLG